MKEPYKFLGHHGDSQMSSRGAVERRHLVFHRFCPELIKSSNKTFPIPGWTHYTDTERGS